MNSSKTKAAEPIDVVLIGAGIMSATLAVLLKELDPSLKIQIFEKLDQPAQESSNAWNNAGTGHAALCELNYTPEKPDGTVDISKALQVNTEFDLSRQLWAHLVRKGAIKDPQKFIHSVPHYSFVRGADDWAFSRCSGSHNQSRNRCDRIHPLRRIPASFFSRLAQGADDAVCNYVVWSFGIRYAWRRVIHHCAWRRTHCHGHHRLRSQMEIN
jgi:hypothetical protein